MDQVREGRKPGWFWADNKVLDVYAKEIGPHATLVYMVLVRHLNAEGQCWPSFQYIADMVGISRRAVMRAIDTLEGANLIVVEKRFTEKKGQTTNCYTIVDMQDIAAHEPRRSSPIPPVTDSHSPYDTQSLPPVTDSHSNKTYRNKTQGTSGGVDNSRLSAENAAAAVDQDVVNRLMNKKGCALNRNQAIAYASRHTFTPDELDGLDEWAPAKRDQGKNPAAILAKDYVPYGDLPDDLPKAKRKDLWPQLPGGGVDYDELNKIARTKPWILQNRWA